MAEFDSSARASQLLATTFIFMLGRVKEMFPYSAVSDDIVSVIKVV